MEVAAQSIKGKIRHTWGTSEECIFSLIKGLLTVRLGTHVGFSPLLILSISSARSLISISVSALCLSTSLGKLKTPTLCPVLEFCDELSKECFAANSLSSSIIGPSQNSVLILSSEGFRMIMGGSIASLTLFGRLSYSYSIGMVGEEEMDVHLDNLAWSVVSLDHVALQKSFCQMSGDV